MDQVPSATTPNRCYSTSVAVDSVSEPTRLSGNLASVTSADDPLQPLLDVAGVGDSADRDALRRLWGLIGDEDEQRFDEFLEAVSPEDEHGERLALRAGQWSIDLRKTAVRTTVLTALVGGALATQGLSEFAIGFATAILPTVIEVERIELGAGDRRLLIELRARSDLGSEEHLYAALPEEVRAEINRYDFADFIERLREAGLAVGPDGESMRLRAP